MAFDLIRQVDFVHQKAVDKMDWRKNGKIAIVINKHKGE